MFFMKKNDSNPLDLISFFNQNSEKFISILQKTDPYTENPYWVEIQNFYNTLEQKEKKVVNSLINKVIINTMSDVFGLLDGNSQFSNSNISLKSKNGTVIELQDSFLSEIEDTGLI